MPVLPLAAEATNYSEEKTETLMRAVVAYNRYHVRQLMKEDSTWFQGWQDLPVHEQDLSDVLQQIADRVQNVGDTEEDDDDGASEQV